MNWESRIFQAGMVAIGLLIFSLWVAIMKAIWIGILSMGAP